MLKVTSDVPSEPFAFDPVVVVLLLAAVTAAVLVVVSRRSQGSRR